MYVNTRLFSPVAIGGVTRAPKGSYEYNEWWDEQLIRCYNGYSVGGVRITGRHYYYLNFWPIKASLVRGGRKVTRLPMFIDMDHMFFNELDRCIAQGKDLAVLKRRQGGFSYKLGAVGGYDFELVPDSYTLITSGEERYSKNTMRMVMAGLNAHADTPFYKKRTPDIPDEYVRAMFQEKDENGIIRESGINSVIERRTASDPQSLVGLSPSKILYEESGKFKDIKQVKLYMDSAMEEQGARTGIQIMIGTGGEAGTGIEEFGDMFYNPARYNLMEYDNDFASELGIDGGSSSKIGLFIPADYFTEAMDADGNSNRQEARRLIIAKREALKQDKDAWVKYVTQMPLTPEEALMRSSGNVFPSQPLLEQQAALLRRAPGMPEVRPVSIKWVRDEDGMATGVEWKDDPRGIFMMVEPPVTEDGGDGCAYFAGTDSYDKDIAADPERASKGSCTIFKGFRKFSDTNYDLPVMKMVDRPERAEIFFENVAKMCVMYNWCQNLIEWSNITIFNWMRNNGFGRLIKERPEIAYANVANSRVQNRDGIDPSTKHAWITMASDWISSGGASRLYDPETVDKLLSFRLDKNCDESISFMLALLNMRDAPRVRAAARTEEFPFVYQRYAMDRGRIRRV